MSKTKKVRLEVKKANVEIQQYITRLEMQCGSLGETVSNYRETVKRMHEAYGARIDRQAAVYKKRVGFWRAVALGAIVGALLGCSL